MIYDCKGIESNWNYVANLIQNNDIIYLNEHHIHKWDKKLITLLACVTEVTIKLNDTNVTPSLKLMGKFNERLRTVKLIYEIR